MKTKLLFTKQKSNALYYLLVLFLCFNYGYSQELVKNGSCDDFQDETGDNADAWDMTPNSTVKLNGANGVESPSPYKYDEDNNPDGWSNDALEDALEIKYLGEAGSLDEQPGSTSSGNNDTRGVKLYDDGNPSITGSSRRLYQRVVGLTIDNVYNFSIDSRSEAAGTTSEVYILNTQIANEDGIDANGYNDASVVTGMDITNDNPDWVTNTFSFTATTTEVVIYVRSLGSVDTDTEVFYDNISLQQDNTQSVDDVLASNFKVYPNPASDYINIESKNVKVSSVDLYNILGAKVLSSGLIQNRVNVSNLSKGVYLMKINSVDGSVTKKVVIE
ncbi:conserved hypothetical protein [Formosa agariphila KMM 3901]|uniref:Secretion system C-terminal sorting domain-containing protein n=1 Tax=Formosa agariphila (strain DSM 15362 / KCTC 12365 / LMG 23005 / KMM 3901 / M-2Alg 35-1) TaxID=1347342 RepID=T2KR35_FORAG|nr:T9SS type A sorting domain-containing protein [Formosa agariphila]CDF80454.1 conserved hypothetical protein [Formosa agariphila KMM 3901]